MPNSIFDLTKTANKSTTEIGDIVTYKLEATNKLMFKVKDAHVEDIIPSGFSYIPNSLYVDGKKIDDFVPTSSSVLMLPVGDLGPEQKVTIFYQLKVGINVVEGPAKNQANLQAVSPSGETLKGGDVTSTVFVKKGVFSKNGSIIGRLYIDSEDIGYTNKENGDTSLENISIYTANGIKITTDNKGKYSIPDLPNGDLLLSLDTKTLPKNVYLPEEGIKIANERKSELEKATVSKIDVNKAITYNVIEGKDLTIKNSSGMKAVIELKDGKDFIVKNNSNLYASNQLGIGASNNERIVNQKDLGLIKGLNEFKVNFFDLNNKVVKTKNIRINVLANVKIPKKDFWIGNTGISRKVLVPASGLAKANFRLVRLEPFQLSLKTSEEEKDKPSNSLRAVYVYPNKFTTKQLPYITYPDIQNHWSKGIVEYESALEIIHGYPDGTFKPGRSITRSEATKLVLVAIKSFDVKIGTSLGYIINADAKVTAKIIDKNGKAIKTFFSGIDKKAGVNVMYWDGKGDDAKLLEPAKYTFEVIVNSSTVTKTLKTDMEVITPIPNYHPNGKALFPDVPEWYWGTSFIKVANEEKLISGYKDGNFLPDKFIPRYEMAELAVKALGLDLSLGSDKLKFKDADQVPDSAKKYVYLAEMYGLLRTFPDGNFYPLRNTNRADIANLVLELINRQKVDTDIAGSIVDEINELNVEGQKLNLEKEKKFLIKVKKKYSDDVNVTTFETDKLKVIIDELYKNKGVKRGLFDSFGN